jgi:hypothetical protein
MKLLPKTKDALVLRTDFSDHAVWQSICETIREPQDEYEAFVECLDDKEFADLPKDQLLKRLPEGYPHTFLIVVDRQAITHPEHPLLVLDVFEDPGREFRAIPSQIAPIENNLSNGSLDFDDFAEAVDEDDEILRRSPEA